MPIKERCRIEGVRRPRASTSTFVLFPFSVAGGADRAAVTFHTRSARVAAAHLPRLDAEQRGYAAFRRREPADPRRVGGGGARHAGRPRPAGQADIVAVS